MFRSTALERVAGFPSQQEEDTSTVLDVTVAAPLKLETTGVAYN
jgi:hypothetical protein